MRITALTENTTQGDFGTEHGLSLYIETGTHRVLFDTGQTGLFAENARKLGIDLGSVDIAVISHGHYDHGGGLKTFLSANSKAPVYISKYAFEPHYNSEGKYIGLDRSLMGNSRFIYTNDITEIEPGMTLYSCNDREKEIPIDASGMKTEIEPGMTIYSCNDMEKEIPLDASGLKMEAGGRMQDEDFRHEQYLLIEEGGKRILISGCSHKGIINIVKWFEPDFLVGGFHFWKLPMDEKLREYSEILDSFPTEYYTCHCTGTEQYQFMLPLMKKLHYISTGQTIVL